MLKSNNYKTLNYIKFIVNRKNTENYIKNGGAYMASTNNLEMEKETNSTKNSSSNVSLPSELKQKLQSIDSKYSTELSTWKDKQSSLTLTDDEANQLANNQLSEYYNTQLSKIQNTYTNKQDKLEQSKISTQNKYDSQLDNAQEDYQEDKTDLKFDSIEKGWRVSSIYNNELSQIESEYNSTKGNLSAEQSSKLDSLTFQQSLLEDEKESALQSFDIAYAQKLSEKIEDIKEEFEKVNSTERGEADSKVEDILSDIGREKTAEVLYYLNSYSKEDAIKFLNDNSELESELGTSWYTALVNWINKK